MKQEIVVFAHIPKTAGTTMRGILTHQYRRKRVYIEDNLMLPHNMAQLKRCLDNEPSQIDAIGAHAGYGFHQYLPDRYHYRYFTFLRHPVDRAISNYYQWQRARKIPADMSLETYVTDYPLAGQNLQTAFLSGILNDYFLAGKEVMDLMPENVFADADTAEILAQAKDNLEQHDAIGLTERFDESLLLIAKTFGWRWYNLPYLRYNRGYNRPPQSEISPETRQLIADLNQLDLELYDHAISVFTRQIETHGDWVARQLSTFQTVNGFIAKVIPPLLPVARPVYRRIRMLR